MTSNGGAPHLQAAGSNGHISPMELESLASGDAYGDKSKSPNNNNHASLDRLAMAGTPSHPVQKLLLMLRLYFELYPKPMYALSAALVCGFFYWIMPTSFASAKSQMRNYMSHDYTALEDNFNFQTAQLDHWCLFGGDDKCYCEDPTEAQARSEVHGWANAHKRNKWLVDQAIGKYGANKVDVVFFGDQTVQSWDGLWLDRKAPEGDKIANYWNKTFASKDSTFNGVALGIYGDRLNNILWRIKHGEIPKSLDPKVFWLIMGTNDLALGMCSEEVVTLGIMRIAEELHHLYPTSIVVIQGILPRSNHKDGSLEGKTSRYANRDIIAEKAKAKMQRNKNKHKNGGGGLFKPHAAGAGVDAGTNPGGRRVLLEDASGHHHHAHAFDEHHYNPMDQFLDNYLEHYDEPDVTNQLMDDYWGPHVSEVMDEDDEQAELQDNEVTERALQDLTTHKADDENADAPKEAKTDGGSVISKPNKGQYQYSDKDKVISKQNQHRAPMPHFDFYLWPSIKAINKELEGFCSKHEHFVYFDADDLVLGSIGNQHYRAAHKTIITELMPNYVHLSYLGHKVVIDVLNDELKRIIYDDDEENDIEKAKSKGGRRRRTTEETEQ